MVLPKTFSFIGYIYLLSNDKTNSLSNKLLMVPYKSPSIGVSLIKLEISYL